MHYLLCTPTYFGVEYVINPWMLGNVGKVGADAGAQWDALYRLLTETLGVTVELVAPQPGLPDMVFTANAGLVRGAVAVPSRFRFPERQREEPYFHAWFRDNGFTLQEIPEGIAFEGEGDALFDGADPGLLWAADGFRTDPASHPYLSEIFGVATVSLKLADTRYYHLDTCFAPLPGGFYLLYLPAFDERSRETLRDHIPETHRLALSDEDAAAFACNAVPIGDHALVMNAATPELTAWLRERSFTIYTTPLDEFMKAGGAAKCLCLRLPDTAP